MKQRKQEKIEKKTQSASISLELSFSDQDLDEQSQAQFKRSPSKKTLKKSVTEGESKKKYSKNEQNSFKSLDSIIEYIKEHTSHNYECRYDELGKPLKTIANLGGKKGQLARMTRQGDYHGLTLELTQDVLPLFNSHRIIDIIKTLDEEDVQLALIRSGWYNRLCVHGSTCIYYIVYRWLKKLSLPIPAFIEQKYEILNLYEIRVLQDAEFKKTLEQVINTDYHSPIQCSFKIYSIGMNENVGVSVVPEEWLGREFINGYSLHQEMDTLPWRLGKPRVVYCATYGLQVEDLRGFTKQPLLEGIGIVAEAIFTNENFDFQIYHGNEIKECLQRMQQNESLSYMIINNRKPEELLQYVQSEDSQQGNNFIKQGKLLIVCQMERLFKVLPEYQQISETVGFLSSRLQKSIRRGRGCSQTLYDTVQKLSHSKPYCLPEMKMIRVSANRQLLWRLYVSTFEDSRPYIVKDLDSGLLSLQNILIMSLICQQDPNLQLNQWVIDKIAKTALSVQLADKSEDLIKWRDYKRDTIKQLDIIPFKGIEGLIPIYNSLVMAIKFQPMMSGDLEMFKAFLNWLNISYPNLKSLEYFNDVQKYFLNSNPQQENDALLAGIDMHCVPRIIIQLQAELPFPPNNEFTTKKISEFIWQVSSQYNVREIMQTQYIPTNKEQKGAIGILKQLQSQYLDRDNTKSFQTQFKNTQKKSQNEIQIIREEYQSPINLKIARVGFLSLFGIRRNISLKKQYDVFLCGTQEQPIKAKYSNDGIEKLSYVQGEELEQIQQKLFQKLSENKFYINVPSPPFGYRWIFDTNAKLFGQYLKEQGIFKVFSQGQSYEVQFFNASNLMQKLNPAKELPFSIDIENLIKELFYISEQKDFLFSRIQNQIINIELEDGYVFRWKYLIPKITQFPLNNVMQLVYLRLIQSDEITFAITREGLRCGQELSYEYEGSILRMLYLITLIYGCYRIVNGGMKWILLREKMQVNYFTMIEDLKSTIQPSVIKFKQTPLRSEQFQIKTKLWDHQQQTSDIISSGFLNDFKKGLGDASCVGAGKTLTALSVMSQLVQREQSQSGHFLVLVPQKVLIHTWITEIEKHTSGSNIIIQLSNGTLVNHQRGCVFLDKYSKNNEVYINQFDSSIVISTLGRFRDHNIDGAQFLLLVVDECLSVQNNEAFQTQAAFKQALLSRYGVLLLSATFFRSRFEKLFYLIKILQTQLPENRDYLDTILNESIRHWITTTNRISLTNIQRNQYQEIQNTLVSNEVKYGKLFSFLTSQKTYIINIESVLKNISSKKPNLKALIYCQSQEEANEIAQKYSTFLTINLFYSQASLSAEKKKKKIQQAVIFRHLQKNQKIFAGNYQNLTKELHYFGHFFYLSNILQNSVEQVNIVSTEIGLYPNIQKNHCVVSYQKGTFGLNDLIKYNTIISRPPEPDKLPQMKGRLDRPGQKENTLYLEYIITEDTIEEAYMTRIELANHFINKHLMPLAQFYEMAVQQK